MYPAAVTRLAQIYKSKYIPTFTSINRYNKLFRSTRTFNEYASNHLRNRKMVSNVCQSLYAPILSNLSIIIQGGPFKVGGFEKEKEILNLEN